MQIGVIEGEVDTSSFSFRATEEVKKFDFISVKSDGTWILGQVEEVTKHPEGETVAEANIIGYRDKGLTKAPRHVIEPDSIVYRADQELISDTLGLEEAGLRIGNLETNPDIDIFVDAEDFYKHFAVLAQTGAGKCVTPDTPILKGDGSLKTIKEIFESSEDIINSSEDEELRILNNCQVKAINDEYDQVDADALYAYRKKADTVLRIRTSSGREVKVTPEHPLLRAEGGYSFIEAEELEEGEHIAIPREVQTSSSDRIKLSGGLKNAVRAEKRRRRKMTDNYRKFNQLEMDGRGVTEIAEKLSVSKSTVENWKYCDSNPNNSPGLAVSRNAKGIEVPEVFTREFAEFLSLIISEGTEQHDRGSYRIVFTNESSKLIEKFERCSKELFGLESRKFGENARYIDSISLKHLLDDLGYRTLRKSRTKLIPQIVLQSSQECIACFLRTYFDAEGCMEDHEITLSSASEDIVNKISYMLLDFGIVARLSTREKEATNSDHEGDVYHRLSISGVDQMEKFAKTIGFGIERKQKKLEKYVKSHEGNTNTDTIPIEGKCLRRERQKLNLSQKELGNSIGSHSTLVSLYERNERRPSRKKFRGLAEVLENSTFEDLANSDVYWDRVESIEEVEYTGYVYDLTVREHHNFIAGKGGIVCHNSYLTGVLIEELLEQNLPVIIVDPHGEYSSLSQPNEESEKPREYEVKEYSPNTDINQTAIPLSFSSVNMEKKELMDVIPDSLTNSQMGVLYNALKRLRDKGEDYNLNDLMDAVSHEESTAKWNLLNSMEQIERSGLFSDNPVDLENLVEPGEATIINLKAVEPEPAEITAYLLAKKLFDLRKRNLVPPFLMILEEAHNFAPEKGFQQALSNDILRKIASEGRKFGMGIGVISQRPARIDKNVLSQCNTQFILRVTNPNDLKAISKSFEGVTSEVESMIKSLPPGVCFVLGNEYPVMTDVRTRRSKHGGETQTSEEYVERTTVSVFEPGRSVQELEADRGDKYEVAYYPLYYLENDEEEVLVDGTSGDVKAEREKLSGQEEKIFDLVVAGDSKGEIVENLDIGVAKVASVIDKLVEKGRLDEENSVEESVLDVERNENSVEVEKLIDYELDVSELELEIEGFNAQKVYYPYYSRGEEVYDPILDKSV